MRWSISREIFFYFCECFCMTTGKLNVSIPNARAK
jgi:hypothetical protein